MFRKIMFSTLLLTSFAFAAEISSKQLEQKINLLEQRIEKLESFIQSKQTANKVHTPVAVAVPQKVAEKPIIEIPKTASEYQCKLYVFGTVIEGYYANASEGEVAVRNKCLQTQDAYYCQNREVKCVPVE